MICCLLPTFLRDDYLRACRALLKEIVRVLRYEMNFVALCRGFMQERTDTQFKELDSALKVCYIPPSLPSTLHPSFHPSIHTSLPPSLPPSTHPSTHSPTHPSHPILSAHLSLSQSIHSFIPPSTHPLFPLLTGENVPIPCGLDHHDNNAVNLANCEGSCCCIL